MNTSEEDNWIETTRDAPQGMRCWRMFFHWRNVWIN